MYLGDDLSALLLPTYLGSFLLFLAPGLALVLLVPQLSIDRPLVLPVAFTASSLCGYVAFWLYFLDPGIGRLFSLAITGGGLAAGSAVLLIRRSSRELLQCPDVALPIVLVVLV